VTVRLIGDGELARLEVLSDAEHVMPSLTMSTSSAAPVSPAETPPEPAMKTAETVNEAAVKTVNEPMVKMRKPLRYYDRRPEPARARRTRSRWPSRDNTRIVVIIGIRISIRIFRRRNDIHLRRQSQRALGWARQLSAALTKIAPAVTTSRR